MFFNQQEFISEFITNRKKSLFLRDIEEYKTKLNEAIHGKSILVIGGAGTIGSSFIKEVLKFAPSKLYVVDTNENGLTELTRDIRSSDELKVPNEYRTYPLNFANDIFKKIMRAEGPFNIVANFAAHKHVRSEKDKYSVEAMLENNVFNAKKLLDLLLEFPPEKFFCVSTDKATNPVNVMGASKKLMEDLIMSYAKDINITTARFANVAFSNGSLLYGYKERIAKRQPLSCPSDVKRFFVSPEESGQICMMACVLGMSGDVFFPKLDPEQMVYFKTITDRYIEQLGLTLDLCSSDKEAISKAKKLNLDSRLYPVYYFKTNTSGEKLFEEFYSEEDEVDFETFESLGVIKNSEKKSREDIELLIDEMKKLLSNNSYEKSDIVKLINEFVPSFEHIETGKNLDDRI